MRPAYKQGGSMFSAIAANSGLKKILIVDDSAVMRQQIRASLAGKADIVEATNGEEALNILTSLGKTAEFALILVDVHMPVMSGPAFVEAARAKVKAGELPDVPMVMLTTENSLQSIAHVKSLGGVYGWIVKPVEQDLIRKLVSRFIDQGSV